MITTNPTPTFSIYRSDGSKVPTLKKSFLVKEHISHLDYFKGYKTLEDGTVWKLILENEVISDIKIKGHSDTSFCIVSYQAHTHGNYAIARLVKEKPTRDIVQRDLRHWIYGKTGVL